ncbi:MAG: ArgE/DapE family deacylase [Candidatus Neomarinimicrobiota bacterium]
MNLKAQLLEYFSANQSQIRTQVISLVTEMVRQKTINVVSDKLPEFPFLKFRGEEYRVADIIKRELENSGIDYKIFARMEGRPNVISKLGQGRSGQCLLMPAHMDIVPAGEGWDTDPFEVVEKDGKLFGRGTLDNKGPLASILIAAQVLKKLGIDQELSGELMIAALSDEEAEDPDGINYGIGYLVEEKLINPTMSVVPDIGGDMLEIDVAEKGRTVIRITAIGKQAHGATPEKGVNAVYMMAKLVTEIEKMKFRYEVHPVLGHPTLNLGEIHGGVASNIVPGTCYIYIDIRAVPGQTEKILLDQLQECITKVPAGDFKVEVLSSNQPHAISPKVELVRKIQENAKEYLNLEPQAIGQGGGTYAKTLCLNGIDAVGWGPGDGDAFHVANEYIEIKQLIDFALMTCLLAVDLLA